MQFTRSRFRHMLETANWSGFTHAVVRDLTESKTHVFNAKLEYVGMYLNEKNLYMVPYEPFCEQAILHMNRDPQVVDHLGIMDLSKSKPQKVKTYKRNIYKEFKDCPDMFRIYDSLIAGLVHRIDERFVFILTTDNELHLGDKHDNVC